MPSLVVAIPEGGHVPIFEGGLIRSVFFEEIHFNDTPARPGPLEAISCKVA